MVEFGTRGGRSTRFVTLGFVLMCIAALLPITQARAASYATPSGIVTVSRATTSLAIGWRAVNGAPRYRVQYADNPSMTNPVYRRSTDTYEELTGLFPGTTYYVKVRVISADGKNLTPYSPAVRITTRADGGFPLLSPTGLGSPTIGATTATLVWDPRGTSGWYRLQYSTSAAMTNPGYRRFSSLSGTLTTLTAGAKYFVRVRVIDAEGTSLSSYSPAVTLTMPSEIVTAATGTRSAPLKVATFNVKCANCYSGLPNELTWYARRASVAAAIREQAPDVLGLQEAAQSWLKDSSGNPINLSQFEDLVARLGTPYQLANPKRNNCVKHTTPSKCVYADQGASKGTKIVYNSATVKLVTQGSKRLSAIDPNDNERYVAWAIFRHAASGRAFFFADTHLEPNDDKSGSTLYYDLRRKQAAEVIATIKAKNPDDLPVILVGDLNSHKWTAPSNAPYDVILAGGLHDQLGNTYRSTHTATGATVETRVRTNFATYNGFKRTAPRSAYINGTHLDYIFTTPMRMSAWENVANLDGSGNFVGVIPSDHNLIQAEVYLP